MSQSSVPAPWKTVTLGDVASVSRGASPRPIASPRWFENKSDVGWVRISDLGRSDGLTLRATTQRLSAEGIARSRYLPPGTLILSIAATVGVPIVTGIPTCIHDGFVSIENLKGVHQPYLLYALKAAQSALRKAGQTGSQANINSDIVKRLPLLLPPEEEQRAIADALRDTDELILSFQRFISKKQAIKRGMLQELLTGKASLQNSPSSGRDATLGELVTWLSGGTPDRNNPAYWGGAIPWISAATLRRTRVHDSDQHLTAAGVRAGSKIAPAGATLLLVRGMALHREMRIGMATRPVSFNQDVKALIPKPGVLPEYLVYALQARSSHMLDLVSSAGSGTGVLDTQLLQRLPIWIPDETSQCRIVAAINAVDRNVEELHHSLSKARAIKQGMMQMLLTGRNRLLAQGEGYE
ncbi:MULTISPECIES: restriction endonuclease subunit S [Streptomyces]|uniref:restriction endonuclease subunit S n=1 Tax=Streptomyces TaxID=1883 RepID=UPI0036BC622B